MGLVRPKCYYETHPQHVTDIELGIVETEVVSCN